MRLLDAPGHGHLLDEPPITDAGRLAGFPLRSIGSEPTCPHVLFGHSMGATVTYGTTRRLVGRGLPLPVRVVVWRVASQPAAQRG